MTTLLPDDHAVEPPLVEGSKKLSGNADLDLQRQCRIGGQSGVQADSAIQNLNVIADAKPKAICQRRLADPTRRAIFERLCREGEKTVGALAARTGVSQPAVSKHLGVLKQAGLVRDRHEGRQTHYSAQLGALAPLIDWTSQIAGFWQSRFDHLEDCSKGRTNEQYCHRNAFRRCRT